jgi:hypothetical protein
MKLLPIYRKESKQYFSDFGNTTIVRRGYCTFHTHHYKPGTKFSLLGISQTEDLISEGVVDITDCIDPNVQLAGFLLRITKESGLHHFYYHEADELPPATFSAIQDNYRAVLLQFKTGLHLNIDGEWLEFGIDAFGSVSLELGDTEVHFSVKPGKDSPHKVEVVGYDLHARRVNHNRRPR